MDSITDEKICLCALNRIFGFEPRTARALIGGFGKLTDLFSLNERQKRELFGPFSKHAETLNHNALEKEKEELERLRTEKITFVGLTEDGYPRRLSECEDAPPGLYIRCCGEPAATLSPKRAIAVVGTRSMTPYGAEWCESIVSALAASGEKPTVISGLAYGTDITAQNAAIEYGLGTVGVMATGPDAVYPAPHRRFAERIASTEGCALVTDYPPGTVPLAVNFIRRNRIIAGLSDAVILTESAAKGGGMITARQAFSYDRDVFAVPGRSGDPRSQGCNILIRENIAQLIDSTDSLIKALGLNGGNGRKKLFEPDRIIAASGGRNNAADCRLMSGILRIVHDRPGITTEDIASELGESYARIAELTGRLECDGFLHTDLVGSCRIDRRKCCT